MKLALINDLGGTIVTTVLYTDIEQTLVNGDFARVDFTRLLRIAIAVANKDQQKLERQLDT